MLHPSDAALDRALDSIRRHLDAATCQILDMTLSLARSPTTAPADGRALLDGLSGNPAVSAALATYWQDQDTDAALASLDAFLASGGAEIGDFAGPEGTRAEIGDFIAPRNPDETQAQPGRDDAAPRSACMLEDSSPYHPTPSPTSSPLDLPSDPDTLLSALLPEATSSGSRMPAQGRAHMTSTRADQIRRAVLFAAHQGTPLNTFLTVIYRDHDVCRSGGSIAAARAAVKRTLEDFRGGLPYVNTEENPERGGWGLHLHELLHLPPATYARDLDRLLTKLSKRYNKRLTELCDRHGIPYTAKTSARAKYDLLFLRKVDADRTHLRRSRAWRELKASTDPEKRAELERALDEARQDVELHSLPFYVSFPAGQEGQPLSHRHVMERSLPYILKAIDPEGSATDRHGHRKRLGDMERGATPNGDVHLQRQSRRRPKRSENIANSINATAQKAAGWIMPPEAGPLEAVLSPGVRGAQRVREVMAWLELDNDIRELEALWHEEAIAKDTGNITAVDGFDLPVISPIW